MTKSVGPDLDRRAFLKGLMLLTGTGVAGTTGLLGCRVSGPEGTLNVLNWSDYIDPGVIEDFEKTHGIQLNYDTYASNDELFAKLETGASGYDVIFPTHFNVPGMVQRGLLHPLDQSQIKNYRHLDARFLNQPHDPNNQYSLPYLWGTTGIGYNTKEVLTEVTSWEALLAPTQRLQNRISMLDEMRPAIGAALKFLGYSLNSRDLDQLNEAKAVLLDQRDYVLAYTSDTYMQLLQSEEILMSQGYSGDIYQIRSENPEIEYVIPSDGTDIWMDTMCIPADAPSPELAHAFINFLLDPTNMAKITNAVWYPNAVSASLPMIRDEIRNDPSIYPPDEILDRCESYEELGDFTPIYERLWTELKNA